jgi:Leucine-rich repeat (LRR) protein
MTKRLFAVLIALAIAVVTVPSVSAYGEGVYPELTICYDSPVKITLADKNITDSELAEMVENGEIPRNVTGLYLHDNRITDITPLAGLTELVDLILCGNPISDHSPLSSLTNLLILNSSRTGFNDITPISGLTQLRWLSLGENQISDLTPLRRLINLENLELSVNPISDVSPLSHLTKLLSLNLMQCEITDVAPLARIRSLRALDLEHNGISDFSPLYTLTNLEWRNYANQWIPPPETGIDLTASSMIIAGIAVYFSRRRQKA